MTTDPLAAEAERLGIDLRWGPVPADLSAAPPPPRWLQVKGDTVLVRFPGGSRLLVTGGTQIVAHWPGIQQSTDEASWIIDTWGIPLALLQRGNIALHAATVRVHGRTVAIAGASGAGKSTTALGLAGRGHTMVVDEATICEVRAGAVLVHPFRRRVNLTTESLQRLGVELRGLPPARDSPLKRSFDPGPVDPTPLPLDQILILKRVAAGGEVKRVRLSPQQAIPALSKLANRRGLGPQILGRQRYLELLSAIAESVEVTLLARPMGEWSLDAVIDAVEQSADMTTGA